MATTNFREPTELHTHHPSKSDLSEAVQNTLNHNAPIANHGPKIKDKERAPNNYHPPKPFYNNNPPSGPWRPQNNGYYNQDHNRGKNGGYYQQPWQQGAYYNTQGQYKGINDYGYTPRPWRPNYNDKYMYREGGGYYHSPKPQRPRWQQPSEYEQHYSTPNRYAPL